MNSLWYELQLLMKKWGHGSLIFIFCMEIWLKSQLMLFKILRALLGYSVHWTRIDLFTLIFSELLWNLTCMWSYSDKICMLRMQIQLTFHMYLLQTWFSMKCKFMMHICVTSSQVYIGLPRTKFAFSLCPEFAWIWLQYI